MRPDNLVLSVGHLPEMPDPKCQTQNARVAQLAEQLIRNEQVIGSSPISGSSFAFDCLAATLSG